MRSARPWRLCTDLPGQVPDHLIQMDKVFQAIKPDFIEAMHFLRASAVAEGCMAFPFLRHVAEKTVKMVNDKRSYGQMTIWIMEKILIHING